MTVVPQQYTLHCITIGDSSYTITLYGNNQQIYSGNCGNGNCIRQLLHSSNITNDNTVKSVNGDQVYTCNVVRDDANRNLSLIVNGIKLFLTYFQYNIISSRIFSISY